ncbi:ATP-dependent helicase [uncultured Desulfosarcina sp.]|uniref:ATP-dependent helicase n=1 Tax=uncultured Desulfosarcina sp. TaxID=218289 RepID=UPI0029C76D65|nr:ATP-dependent helicase [uncultured Desulfosarcina sp.]
MFRIIPEQEAVYQSESNRILVNAGPGTGKTVVVVCQAVKFANILLDSGIPQVSRDAKVLVVSLTNYTAENVQCKAEKLLGDQSFRKCLGVNLSTEAIMDRIRFSTLHSFSLSMLIRYGQLSSSAKLSIVGNEYNLKLLEKVLEKMAPAWKDDVVVKGHLLKFWLNWRSEEHLRKVLHKRYPKYRSNGKLIAKVINELVKRKRHENVITFDDMLKQFYQLIVDKRARKNIRRLFPMIIVDEFQDITGLQWKIIRRLVGPSSHLLCTGDDGQTIYSWNGASFSRFRQFMERFPDYKAFYLTENLRSTRRLSKISKRLISQSHYATKKDYNAKRKGKKPKVILNPNPTDNRQYVIDEIKKLTAGGMSFDDIAIIYRHHGDAFELRQQLLRAKIPFKVYRDKSKRDRPFVRVVFALIKIVESDNVDENAWYELLPKVKGLGRKKAADIISLLHGQNLTKIEFPDKLKTSQSLEKLCSDIGHLKEFNMTSTEKLEGIFDIARTLPKVNRYVEHHIKPTFYKLASDGGLFDIIRKYQDRSFPLYYPVEDSHPYSDSYITLSTVHGIKGGEFRTVFYYGSGNDLYRKYHLLKGSKRRENELQVMNVAVTRATQKLYLLFPVDKAKWSKNANVQNPISFLSQASRNNSLFRY